MFDIHHVNTLNTLVRKWPDLWVNFNPIAMSRRPAKAQSCSSDRKWDADRCTLSLWTNRSAKLCSKVDLPKRTRNHAMLWNFESILVSKGPWAVDADWNILHFAAQCSCPSFELDPCALPLYKHDSWTEVLPWSVCHCLLWLFRC